MTRLLVVLIAVSGVLPFCHAEEKEKTASSSASVSVRSDGNGTTGEVIINGKKQPITSSSSNVSVTVVNDKVTVTEGRDNGADAPKRQPQKPTRPVADIAGAGVSCNTTVKDGKAMVEVKSGGRTLKFEYPKEQNVAAKASSTDGKTTITIKGKTVNETFDFDFDEEWKKQNKGF